MRRLRSTARCCGREAVCWLGLGFGGELNRVGGGDEIQMLCGHGGITTQLQRRQTQLRYDTPPPNRSPVPKVVAPQVDVPLARLVVVPVGSLVAPLPRRLRGAGARPVRRVGVVVPAPRVVVPAPRVRVGSAPVVRPVGVVVGVVVGALKGVVEPGVAAG